MSHFVELRRAQPLLGTYVEIRGRGPDELCLRRGLQAGFGAIAHVHRLMSFHDASSDVSRLNRDGFRKAVSVDKWTWRVLSHAQKFAESSGGAFDVTIAPLLSKWGYLPRGQTADKSASFRDVILESRYRVRFRKPLSLDLGGIAKGFAVDRAVESLRAAGVFRGTVNAGGDLRAFGPEAHTVHLRDSTHPAFAAGMITLRNRAVATSGVYFSRRIKDGSAVSPLIDGRTRRPHVRDISVAVSAAECLTADALTKIVLARGEECCGILASCQANAVILERGKSPRVLAAHAPKLR